MLRRQFLQSMTIALVAILSPVKTKLEPWVDGIKQPYSFMIKYGMDVPRGSYFVCNVKENKDAN